MKSEVRLGYKEEENELLTAILIKVEEHNSSSLKGGFFKILP